MRDRWQSLASAGDFSFGAYKMNTMTQVIAALYVALGEAAGGAEAIRTANRVLRDAIEDRAIDDPLAIFRYWNRLRTTKMTGR